MALRRPLILLASALLLLCSVDKTASYLFRDTDKK